ncbi:MarR family transcriptional regulator [Limosilactobacillus sp. STM2_1]|uniref:MarR family transcriptional regulator n=1 Tax=Limosilactobacillus rudii TaxID=2759755 RepID=A0A7W3UJ48_9LACO|nr:MarR family transcriptional regulator [Limosilactobacillus rudii]MBB1078438.1 MarR family transcriptional regulator [Limosilactobacillus rudii]MBB1096568.1 MarR family transcriptional regulator [Limosilactobacillus rudii]MCD7134236.1 MarR family transcriptional regulator [Limosilactobacillus rudii]
MASKKDKFERMNRLLRTYMINMQHFFNTLTPKLALTPQQARTLLYIKEHPGLIQRELGDHFHIRNASITNMLKNLERDGYIIRKNDNESARIKRIFLTKEGIEKAKQIKKVFDETCQKFIEQLDESKIDSVIASMTSLNNDLPK